MFIQKIMAIALITVSILSMKMGEGTIALVFIPAGLGLFFSKRNWIYYG